MRQSFVFVARRRSAVVLAVIVVAASFVGLGEPARAKTEATKTGLVEVGRLPVTTGTPEIEAMELGKFNAGWLIVNPVSRRGYQVFEALYPVPGKGNVNRTVLQAFDLDTLQLGRRIELAGIPITGGAGDAVLPGGTVYAGEVVHAVDPVGKRLYLALSQLGSIDHAIDPMGVGPPPDVQRPLSRFVAVDEVAFERCGGEDDCPVVAQFQVPADQSHLRSYWVEGSTVSRHHARKNEPGRLLALFAQPQAGGSANPTPVDHTVAQWDPSRLQFSGSAALATDPTNSLVTPGELQVLPIDGNGPARRLEPCALGSIAGNDSYTRSNYQWGILATETAVWTACTVGGVVRTDVDPETGDFVVAEGQEGYKLSASIADVFVDEISERLLLRAVGKGQTWWTFDTHRRRFTGAIAAKCSDFGAMAAGVDGTTGRFYTLLPDDVCFDNTGRETAVRGGLMYSDTRLEPAPPLENARPDLAWPAQHRLTVDPVTRRVFVWRNPRGLGAGPKFPGTQSTTVYPAEPFWRVFEDRIPITEEPPEADDSAFTTDVEEDPELTRASYLGSGRGAGVRTLFIGGLEKATPPFEESYCGQDNRELLAGSVGSVEVSDLTVGAEAASLDADAKTQDHLVTPVNTCRPKRWDDPNNPWHHQSSPTNGRPLPETDELAFDEMGEDGRDGVNHYRTACTPDPDDPEKRTTGTATAPEGSDTSPTGERLLSRDQFSAQVVCDPGRDEAGGRATGALSIRELDDAQATARDGSGDPEALAPSAATVRAQAPGDPVRVGWAHTDVQVERDLGEGITVKVDSIARNVVVPGVGTIALVRGEATVTATGRSGGADASYSRTVCGVDFPGLRIADCWDERRQGDLERRMNESMGARGKVRFRPPDPVLYKGSRSGFKAGVQRPASDGFEDNRVAQDTSPALPAMEIVLYNGDGPSGAGRQFVHLANVQAGASYGIACLYGKSAKGGCAREDEVGVVDDGPPPRPPGTVPGEVEYVEVEGPHSVQYLAAQERTKSRESVIERVLKAPFRVAADVLRLLFANPREFGLMVAVWALLYAPCYLGERRRSIRALRARRVVIGA